MMQVEDLLDKLDIRAHDRIRGFAIDQMGTIKVIDSRRTGGIIEVIGTWGDGNSSPILAASLTNRNNYPLLAVARSNSEINVFNHHDGRLVFRTNCVRDDPIVGLHVLADDISDQDSRRFCKLFTCTQKGQVKKSHYTCEGVEELIEQWTVGNDCHMLFSKFDKMGKFSIFGGTKAALHICDFEVGETSWTTEHSDALSSDVSFVSGAFVRGRTDQFVAGYNIHKVSLFDTRSQRPCREFDLFMDLPGRLAGQLMIEGSDSDVIYIATDHGDLYSLDLGTGKRLHFDGIGATHIRFKEMYHNHPWIAPSGPIRVLRKHNDHHLIASACDNFLAIWDTDNRRQISKVGMRSLSHVLFDYTSLNEANQSQQSQLDPKKGDPKPKS